MLLKNWTSNDYFSSHHTHGFCVTKKSGAHEIVLDLNKKTSKTFFTLLIVT